ncbi:MAG: EAL domain-containing protein, partial [Pontixanthobacter sp.]
MEIPGEQTLKSLFNRWPLPLGVMCKQKGGLTKSVGARSPLIRKRKLIVIWTALITAVIGLIELPLPLEDAYRSARAELRTKAAPSDIVFVAIDDRTLRILEKPAPSRSQFAQVTENLFQAGADKVVFDKAFADPTTVADDTALSNTLAKYGASVRLGAFPEVNNGFQQHEALLPNSTLLKNAQLASMMGESRPFGFSVAFETQAFVAGRTIPSISAFLADYKREPGQFYPDFAFDVATIPNVSFIDLLNGKVPADDIAGKRFIVSETHLASTDMRNLPLGDQVPGAFFHVIASHTLDGGLPLDLGWVPACFVALLLVGLQACRARTDPILLWGGVGLLLAVPIALDFWAVNLDVMPAIMALCIGSSWLGRFARKTLSGEINLPLCRTLETVSDPQACDVFSLKIRNFSALSAGAAKTLPAQIADLVMRRIDLVENAESYAFENNALIWLRPRLEARARDHALGIQALFRDGIIIEGSVVHVETGIGLDTNHELAIRQRIRNAAQCAEDASRLGLGVQVADAAYLTERDWQLQTLAELEIALQSRSIELAYQPKVMISTGRIIGAEALLRWEHPTMGAMPTEKLIALVENAGRISALTDYVLDVALEACCEAMMISPDFRIAVNISARSLTDKEFAPTVAAKLAAHHIPPENLILEITET